MLTTDVLKSPYMCVARGGHGAIGTKFANPYIVVQSVHCVWLLSKKKRLAFVIEKPGLAEPPIINPGFANAPVYSHSAEEAND